jgi:hypothetical protein
VADIAIGVTCPRDGTLCACSGAYTDPVLYAQCPVCGQVVSAPNYSQVVLANAPLSAASAPPVTAEIIDAPPDDVPPIIDEPPQEDEDG